MTSSPAQDIKEKLDIVEFLKGYLPLQAAGKNWKALCPFHKERTPSFMVSPERQSWRCFGCGTGGDIFTFLMQYENIEFGEALKILAERAGVELRRMSPAEYKQFGLLYDITEAAKEFFRRALQGSKVAQDYLGHRGLKPETIEDFELGWAPQGRDELTLELINKGFAPEDISRAGLSVKTERGLVIDRFRGRIMFPIFNHTDKVVGFTGRILPEFDTGEMGKYVNSPETPIFTKSKLLYGFSKARPHIREEGHALLVEGQTDFLMCWQTGVKNVVATSGTALTETHLTTLRRYTDSLVLGLDRDEAGASALERAIDMAQAHDFAVRVASYGQYKDPAEAAEHAPSLVREITTHAVPAPEFYFERYLPHGTADFRNREHVGQVRALLGKLKMIAGPLERSTWLSELSKRTGVEEKTLIEEAERVDTPSGFSREAGTVGTQNAEELRKLSRWERLSEEFLASALYEKDFKGADAHAHHLHPAYKRAYELLSQGMRRAEDEALDTLLDIIILRAREFSKEEKDELLSHLEREYVRAQRNELTARVREAERAGDERVLEQVLQKLTELPRV